MQPERIVDHAQAGVLELAWPDGVIKQLSHGYLRSQCKCSVCEAQRRRGVGSVQDDAIRISAIRPVGHYALQLIFSDGHERGIYPWQQLRTLSLA